MTTETATPIEPTTTASFDLFTAIMSMDLPTSCPFNDQPVQDGDKVVGVLSDNMKRLYEMHRRLADELNAQAIDHNRLHREQPHVDHHCEELHREREQKETRLTLLGQIFWDTLRVNFPVIGDGAMIRIAENWQVVTQKGDVQSTIVRRHTSVLITGVGISGPGMGIIDVMSMLGDPRVGGFGMPDGFGDIPDLSGRRRRRPRGL